MRKSTAYIAFMSCAIMLAAAFTVHARTAVNRMGEDLAPCAEIVKALRLTDLCLFTEARYTRHPSMADLFSPFQDHPLALEHFPSGSLLPPPLLRREGT